MILTYVKAGIATAVLGAAFVVGWTVSQRIAAKQLAVAASEIARLQTQVGQCEGVVGRQNEAIARWQREAKDADTRARDAEARAGQVRIITKDRVVEVMRDAPPPDAPCTEAVRWARDAYSQAVSSW